MLVVHVKMLFWLLLKLKQNIYSKILIFSKPGGSRQSLLKKNFPEANSSINKDAIGTTN